MEPGSTPPHPHLRVSSQGSGISLDRDRVLLKLSPVVGRDEPIFLFCYLFHSALLSLEGIVISYFAICLA